MDVDVSVRLDKLAKALESTTALELLTTKVEEDMRPYVKRDTGQLENSARRLSDFAAGRIVYSADRGHGEYASYAYYDENVGDHMGQNAQATARWASAVAADRQAEWAQLLGEEIAKEANG